MKKTLLVILCLIIPLNTFAYTLTSKDEVFVQRITDKVEELVWNWKLDEKKIVKKIETITKKKIWTRIWVIFANVLANLDNLTEQELMNLIEWPSFDINDYTDYVYQIICIDTEWNMSKWSTFLVETQWGLSAFTNEHVVYDSNFCVIKNLLNSKWTASGVNLNYIIPETIKLKVYNDNSDFVFFPLYEDPNTNFNGLWIPLYPCFSFNRNTDFWVWVFNERWSKRQKAWTKVWTLWFPTYAKWQIIITDWIISWLVAVSNKDTNYFNYYVTNRIDSWNSWWLALAETNNGFCVLWMPTWLSIWDYQTQWIVQNINNIIDTSSRND